MLLNGESLRRLGIVKEAMPSSYRAASYELTVGALLTSNGDVVDEYAIPRQGMVKVVSNEYIRMPANRVGYVLVKTSLCNRGILALNIGVVDPDYEGPLSSTLINFGKRKQRIRKGDVFSRLTVHDLEDGSAQSSPTIVPKEKALQDAIEQVDNHLGDTFLDLRTTSQEAANQAFGKYRVVMLAALPGLAVLLAGLTLFLNFANMWVLYAYLKPQDTVRTELIRAELDTRLNELGAQTSTLNEQVLMLERQIAPRAKK